MRARTQKRAVLPARFKEGVGSHNFDDGARRVTTLPKMILSRADKEAAAFQMQKCRDVFFDVQNFLCELVQRTFQPPYFVPILLVDFGRRAGNRATRAPRAERTESQHAKRIATSLSLRESQFSLT